MKRFGSHVRIAEGLVRHETFQDCKKPCTCKATKSSLFTALTVDPNTKACSIVAMKSPQANIICCHDLPIRGFCILSRADSSGKTLLLRELTKSAYNAGNAFAMMLHFTASDDLLIWEQKLRSQLEVYSYDVFNWYDKIMEKKITFGTLHITSMYIALTTSDEKNKHVVVLQQIARNCDIELIVLEQGEATLTIQRTTADAHRYIFKTLHAASIQKAIGIFHQQISRTSQSSTPLLSLGHPRYTVPQKASPVVENGQASASFPTFYDKLNHSEGTSQPKVLNAASAASFQDSRIATPDEESYLELIEDPGSSSQAQISSAGIKQKKTSKVPCENTDESSNHLSQYMMTIPSSPNLYCYIGEKKDESQREDQYTGLNIVKMGRSSFGSRGDHRYPLWQPKEKGCNTPIAASVPTTDESSKGIVELTLYLVASEPLVGEFWVIGALLTRRQDEYLMKKLLDVEKESGRHVVSTPHALQSSSDMEFKIDKCPEGFEILSTAKQVISFGDLKMLSNKSWLVVEFHFMHSDTKQLRFASTVSVSPSDQPQEALSVFRHKKIMVCQLFKDHLKQSQMNQVPLATVAEPSVTKSATIKDDTSNNEKPISNTATGIFQLASDRKEFCHKLEQFHPLGKDWKLFAIELGLTDDEVTHINGSRGSYMDQVLLVLETECSSNYTVENFREIATRLKRSDLLKYLRV